MKLFARAVFAVTVLVLAACDPSSDPVQIESAPISEAITDGARNGGMLGFYFLPPVGFPRPDYNGDFDATRLDDLEVEFCEVNGGGCSTVATYTSTSGNMLVNRLVQPTLMVYTMAYTDG